MRPYAPQGAKRNKSITQGERGAESFGQSGERENYVREGRGINIIIIIILLILLLLLLQLLLLLTSQNNEKETHSACNAATISCSDSDSCSCSLSLSPGTHFNLAVPREFTEALFHVPSENIAFWSCPLSSPPPFMPTLSWLCRRETNQHRGFVRGRFVSG